VIDPRKMTRYDLSVPELEETILFCCSVAGKNAMITAKGLDKFLNEAYNNYVPMGCQNPFEAIRCVIDLQELPGRPSLADRIKSAGMGCYNNRARTFKALADSHLDLETCTADELEQIPGIGRKTSRFFLLHTRRYPRVAVIDTHALKLLRDLEIIDSTHISMTKKNYERLEQEYLEVYDLIGEGRTLAEFDLMVWNHYAGHAKINIPHLSIKHTLALVAKYQEEEYTGDMYDEDDD
jgi:endonuclease III